VARRQAVLAVLAAVAAAPAASAVAAAPAGELTARVADGVLRVADGSGRPLLRATFAAPGGVGAVSARRTGPGVVEVAVRARRAGGAGATTARITTPAAQRWLGFGERSDAVARTAGTVTNVVSEGPYASAAEYAAVRTTIPPWGLRVARDATYFPLPWALSSRGFGVLVGDDEASRFRLGPRRLDVAVERAGLRLVLVAGPRPAGALRRLTARIGRQPAPEAPWVHGPWVQTGHGNTSPGELGYLDRLRRADAPVSVAETHLRYLPCDLDPALRAAEPARTAALRDRGVATLTYVRSEVCADSEVFARGAATGAFLRGPDGAPYTYTAFSGRGPTPVAQFDFTRPAGAALFASVLDRTADDGHSGFMEDYGEYTPPGAVAADGTPGPRLRNRHPVLYHRAGQRWADRRPGPQVRFVRSGWTGVAPYAPVVWGGDPTTGWGFDGLTSSVRQGLSMGLSGISRWGSDIGGFFTLGDQRLTPELLARWIQFGAVSGVMRTKAEGIGTPLAGRPQVWEEPVLPVWRRYAKLRTQLHPYLVAADAEYRRTGLPLMRHLSLVDPGDPRAAGEEGTFGVGPDLLAAPVTRPGARTQRVRLPRGAWIELWRAARFRARDGALVLGPAPRPRPGRRTVRVRAPLAELPLLVRAGALLPLLPPDVDTLAAPGADPGTVGLAERRDRLDVLALPRGASTARFDADGTLRSAEGRGRWTLTVRAGRARTVRLQASLRTLRRPFVPCRVRGARSWRYDRATGVLTATARGRVIALTARACA
jgi:alpha-glucosidase (family GH31 glycosyl hydrolase)